MDTTSGALLFFRRIATQLFLGRVSFEWVVSRYSFSQMGLPCSIVPLRIAYSSSFDTQTKHHFGHVTRWLDQTSACLQLACWLAAALRLYSANPLAEF